MAPVTIDPEEFWSATICVAKSVRDVKHLLNSIYAMEIQIRLNR